MTYLSLMIFGYYFERYRNTDSDSEHTAVIELNIGHVASDEFDDFDESDESDESDEINISEEYKESENLNNK